ncbi:MAG: sigma-70 family RNA polymerase sigma factor [Chthoniobacterales bacterium]|nr:sigma-70 family RNA polymerase sigma factor [Chthoniobacterales bacterium]
MNTEARARDLIEPRVFATTRWSVILAAADSASDGPNARDALGELCRTYWRPIFSFVCRRGYSTEDAQDLTQDFFMMILGNNWLQYADESRGRFRSLLLKSLQNFLSHATERRRAQKRGGDFDFVSWDDWMAEAPSQLSISTQAFESLPAERLFDLRWAATVVEQALRRLREECESKGRRRLFETLSAHLATERAEVSYASLATALGIPETAVKKQLHNLRQRYRWLLREEVAQTVGNLTDLDDEIRHLCSVLAAGEAAD